MLYVNLQKEKKRSYTKQIYRDIREKIMKGDLTAGDVLPSTRELSGELSVSRNTVLAAYDMLVSEGLARSVPGSGLYVGEGIAPVQPPFSMGDQQTASLSDEPITPDTVSFDSGIPALDLFPRSKWNTFTSRAFREAPVSALGYDDPQGRPDFRSVLAAYLKNSRGIDCSPEQIIVTTGAKQALSLIAKCLLDDESEVLLEDPSNRNVKQIFSAYTRHITAVPTDREGIVPGLLPAGSCPKLLFTTPSHQFPMGGIMTMGRRQDLISYARKTECLLVEDDYDSEFRYDGTPVNSLYELAPERVIYVGTFSKILYPSLRLGYIVLPSSLVALFREWKRLSDHHSNSVSQLALMCFIESGDLERHIRRMKKVYRKRRDLLLDLLDRYFPGQHRVYGESAGMHLILELPGTEFTAETIRRIREEGVYIVPVEEHTIVKGRHMNQLILGYANLSRRDMEYGLQVIKSAVCG
jgi:GntR family transcriptional regulator/MocR family aminotransferase